MIESLMNHFTKNLESIQYNTAITITEAIRGTSSENLFQELGLESLKSNFHEKSLSYLFQLIPPNNKDFFFSAVISEWNSLDINIRKYSSINVFKKERLKFIRLEQNSAYNINDTKGLTLLPRLRLGLSHLGDHKFRHNFQDCVPSMGSCGQDIETTTPFLLHCPNHHCARKTLFHKVNQVSGTISRQSDSTITKILLFGDNKLDLEANEILLMSIIELISLTERFICPLFE